MSLGLDVNGLSTCMAHPLTEDTHLREGEAGVFLLSRLVVPTPSEEKPNGVLSPRASRTYPDHHRPECLVLLAVDQGVGEDAGLWFVGTSLFCFGRFGARRWVLAGPSRRQYRVELSVSDDRRAARRS
jgi:hypothetical protein